MRYIFFLFIILMACTPKKEPAIVIKGQIDNEISNQILLFKETDIEKKDHIVVDTLLVNANGTFEKIIFDEPYFYTLEINDRKAIPLLLNIGQSVNITINTDTVVVSGSDDTNLYNLFERFREESLEHLVKNIRRKILAEQEKENPNQMIIDSLGALEIENYKTHITELNNYIKENLSESIALYPTSLRWIGDNNIPFYKGLVEDFKLKYPQLSITKKLEEKVLRLQQTAVGGIAANVSLPDAFGQNIALFDVKQRYTIIDFWASWCGPCRRESDLLCKMYQKYKDKGLEIYGISLDTKKELWTAAIEQDRRTWINVSSLEAFKTPAVFDYTVTALPVNFIIDKEGKILAKDLHGEELKVFINQLFNPEKGF
ncbi:MAG: hypothetical protein CR989_02725 [Flavobacteriales bacterium]|nr:MAG: hypothetical protein CR989_02725 [Flavobacteriales bacterium]